MELGQYFNIIVTPINRVSNLFTKKLKNKLFLFFFMISVVPILLIGGLVYQVTSNILVDRVTTSSTDLIMKKISYFDEVFDEVNKIIYEGTTSPDTTKFLNYVDENSKDSPETNQILDRMSSKFEYMLKLKGDFINSIVILPQKDGYAFFRGLRNFDYVDDFSQLEIYKNTESSKNLVLWSFEMEAGTKRYFITASSSIIDGLTNKTIGVFAVYLDIKKIREIFEHSGMGEDESLFVLDSNNTIIYHSDYTKIGQQYNDTVILSTINSNNQGNFLHDINSKTNIITYYTSSNSGWRIINTVPYENILKDAKIILYITILISTACLIYAFIIAILFNSSLYRPIRRLMFAMQELGKGNFQYRIKSKRKDEFGKLSDGFDSMINQITILIETNKLEQKQKKESEIKALQSQITPHFLYNTLNSIKIMVKAGRKEDSERSITALIGLLKVSLSNTNEIVSILEELNYVKNYIEIMEFRYEKKVEVVYDIDNNLLCCGILKFILQPIVENCFIHAFSEEKANLKIVLHIFKQNEGVMVEVLDNGIGMDLEMEQRVENILNRNKQTRIKFSSIGLINIHERIQLNYGTEYGLRLDGKIGEGTKVCIKLPYIEIV